MILYLWARNHPDFHPSVYIAAGSPEGRAPAPIQGLGWKLTWARSDVWSVSANASALVFLAAIVSMVIGSGLSVILHPILGDWSFLLLPLSLLSAGLLTSLDRIFWTIQRFHDLGKSWVWALGPPIGVVAALAIAVATPFVLGEPVTIIISAIVLLLIAAPIGAMYVHWLYKPGMAGDNRYGPEPSPIQDTWREL